MAISVRAIKSGSIKITTRAMLLLAMTILSAGLSAREVITLQQAETIAVTRDSLTKAYLSQSDAYRQQSVVADTLPDPKIKIGIMSLPTDTFKLNQEPMTQTQVGIQQMFPRGDSLGLKSERAVSMSMMAKAKADNQVRKIKRKVRQTWLEYLYWLKAEQVVRQNRKLFTELVSVTEQQYSAGRQKQQDVIQAELELGMLDDRMTKIQTQIEVTKEKLSKLLGDDFNAENIDTNIPEFSVAVNSEQWLELHPMLQMQMSVVKAGEQNVALARQSYKPSWMLDITYGNRKDAANGTKRSDFISAMVMFDLPLFTADRQDQKVAANQSRLISSRNTYEDKKRELINIWRVTQKKARNLVKRVNQFQSVLIPKAGENKKSALYAYQSGRGNFTELMRAQIMELETRLRGLRLQVDYKKEQAMLIYLAGE